MIPAPHPTPQTAHDGDEEEEEEDNEGDDEDVSGVHPPPHMPHHDSMAVGWIGRGAHGVRVQGWGLWVGVVGGVGVGGRGRGLLQFARLHVGRVLRDNGRGNAPLPVSLCV